MLAIPIKSKNNSKISTKFSQSTYFAFYKEGEIFITTFDDKYKIELK